MTYTFTIIKLEQQTDPYVRKSDRKKIYNNKIFSLITIELYLYFSQFSNDIEGFVSFHFRLFKGAVSRKGRQLK